jgi:hypothetical protein
VPIQGFVRFREHQWALQGSNSATISTPANPATRVVPLSGVPSVNRNVTFDDVDEGSLDPIQSPYFGALDITETLTGPTMYDDLPWYLALGVKGPGSPSGATAKTWTIQASSLTADPVVLVTEEFGDDVTTDWYQLFGGTAESLTFSGELTTPVETNIGLRFAGFKQTGSTAYPVTGTVPTAALTVDSTPQRVFLDDAEIFINDTAGAIGTTKISDALASFELGIDNTLDQKRYANGSNTRFQIAGYGRGEREITLTAQWHKQSTIVGTGSESDDWMAATPTKRFVELKFTSPEIITGSTPYSWSVRGAMFYTTREDTEINGNTTVTLTGRFVYDSDLAYAFRSVVVNTLASL